MNPGDRWYKLGMAVALIGAAPLVILLAVCALGAVWTILYQLVLISNGG